MTDDADLDDVGSIAPQTRLFVERIVWCTVATVDPTDSPRTRLMHPVWFWGEAVPIGLVTARTTALKVRHLEHNPTVSCFYWDPAHDTVAIEATAAWLKTEDRIRAWESIKAIEPPVGFDPAMIWPDGPMTDGCGILRLDPFRILTTPAGQERQLWSRRQPPPQGDWIEPKQP